MGERWDLPDEEDVENSGMGDWLDQAMAEQNRKNRNLAGILGDTRETLAQKKRDLGDLLKATQEGSVEEEPAPDLFEEERAEQERSRRGMASFVDEERRRQDEERKSLQDLFGPPGKPRRKR